MQYSLKVGYGKAVLFFAGEDTKEGAFCLFLREKWCIKRSGVSLKGGNFIE